jgi:hypothetical protein
LGERRKEIKKSNRFTDAEFRPLFYEAVNAYTEKHGVEPPISKNIAGQVNGVWKELPCDTCSFVLRSKLHLRCGDDCEVYDFKTKQTVS